MFGGACEFAVITTPPHLGIVYTRQARLFIYSMMIVVGRKRDWLLLKQVESCIVYIRIAAPKAAVLNVGKTT